MGLFAFPYTSVLDVSANSILGNNTASPSTAVALTASQVRSLISVYTTTEVDTLLSGKANTSHTHAASDITSGTIDTARLGSGTADATTYLRGDQTWATVTAGVGGSTGIADNAVLCADGTGGATLQASAFLIPDNFTASPNNTVNHASIQATGSTTNVSVSIVPKGTGSFSLAVPDGTSTGGNARGSHAIDLQTFRGNATQVASAEYSVAIGVYNTANGTSGSVAIGISNAASGLFGAVAIGMSNTVGAWRGGTAIGYQNNATGGGQSVAIGDGCRSTGIQASTSIGRLCTASASNTVAIGNECTASGNDSVSFGNTCTSSGLSSFSTGRFTLASRHGQVAHSGGVFSVSGDAQRVEFVLRNKTTTNSPVTLFLDGTSDRLTIRTGTIIHATILITGSKSDGSSVASYIRQATIKRIGNATSLVGTVNTIGTDESAGTSIAITADDTNDALQIDATGVTSETWRWLAVVYGIELAYGT